MSKLPVQLWRSSAVLAPAITTAAHSISEECIFNSARQAIAASTAALGLNRTSFLGIPEFSSNCVVDFCSRFATPVPYRFLPLSEANAMLIYDQWGWQRPDLSRVAIRRDCTRAKIIWDRVDSLVESFSEEAQRRESDVHAQIFSFSKTLGVSGGGLAWVSGKGWLNRKNDGDSGFVRTLSEIAANPQWGCEDRLRLDRFLRNECEILPPRVQDWLRENSTDGALAKEKQQRRERLELAARILNVNDFPEWMREIIEDRSKPAPGIFPSLLKFDPGIPTAICGKFDVQCVWYHFNFSKEYTGSDWRRVFAIPLHSEVSFAGFEQLLESIREMERTSW